MGGRDRRANISIKLKKIHKVHIMFLIENLMISSLQSSNKN